MREWGRCLRFPRVSRLRAVPVGSASKRRIRLALGAQSARLPFDAGEQGAGVEGWASCVLGYIMPQTAISAALRLFGRYFTANEIPQDGYGSGRFGDQAGVGCTIYFCK